VHLRKEHGHAPVQADANPPVTCFVLETRREMPQLMH